MGISEYCFTHWKVMEKNGIVINVCAVLVENMVIHTHHCIHTQHIVIHTQHIVVHTQPLIRTLPYTISKIVSRPIWFYNYRAYNYLVLLYYLITLTGYPCWWRYWYGSASYDLRNYYRSWGIIDAIPPGNLKLRPTGNHRRGKEHWKVAYSYDTQGLLGHRYTLSLRHSKILTR